jgi:hypothetical protein
MKDLFSGYITALLHFQRLYSVERTGNTIPKGDYRKNLERADRGDLFQVTTEILTDAWTYGEKQNSKNGAGNPAEIVIIYFLCEPGCRSRYSDCLRTGRQRGRNSRLGRVKNFHFSTASRPVLGPKQLPIEWVQGAHSSGVKRPGREADHSAPTSANVKKTCIYTSTPPYAFMAWCLIS